MSSLRPTISVIVPLYNTEKYIKRCVESIVSQTYKDLEIIIVNDASTDNSAAIAKEISQTDDRIKIITHAENKGLFQARITGVENAAGKYIGFVDSDDYVSEDYFRTLVLNAEMNNSDIVVGRTVHENENGYRYIHNLYNTYDFGKLSGAEIAKEYWRQEGRCFIWHTVWNKLYSKKIWIQALPVLKNQNSHLIMAEDFVFSSVLINFAEKLTSVDYGCYYYFQHDGASTSLKGGKAKFIKNLTDLKTAFDFVENYISCKEKYRIDASEHFNAWKNLYSYFWNENVEHSNLSGGDKKQLFRLVKKNLGTADAKIKCPNYFYQISTGYDNRYNDIIALIADEKIKCVSFDIFDTAVVRPFYKPTDIFKMIDRDFAEKFPNIKMSFSELREKSEAEIRSKIYPSNSCRADVSLDEIYERMSVYTDENKDDIKAFQDVEKNAELKYCRARKSVLNIYEAAISLGKKIFFVSDMYLSGDFLKKLLASCGYKRFDGLLVSCEENASKARGDLFELLVKKSGCQPENILHLGDNWEADIENAQVCGINVRFYPKPTDCLQFNISDIKTTHSCVPYKEPSGSAINFEKAVSWLGTGSALAVAANKLYDNPFISYNEYSEMNCDPAFLGYYALGMHLLGFTKWVTEKAIDKKYDTLAFVARDGYLPMRAYEILSKHYSFSPACVYIHTSRKAAMPCCVNSKADMFALYDSITPDVCTPLNLMKMLSPVLKDDIKLDFNEIQYDKPIGDYENYVKVVNFLWDNFDPEKSESFNSAVEKYMRKKLLGRCACVDVGYSGRTQQMLTTLLKKPIDAFYVHKNDSVCNEKERRAGFRVHSFYDCTPSMTGAQRELLFSQYAPSCVSYEVGRSELDMAKPIFDSDNYNYPEDFLISGIQNAAIDFVEDFCQFFGDKIKIMDMRNIDISYPYEYFLSTLTDTDAAMFNCCEFEDDMWAGNTFNLPQAWKRDIAYHKIVPFYIKNAAQTVPPQNTATDIPANADEMAYQVFVQKNIINKNLFRKAFYWLAVDKKYFKSRAKDYITGKKTKKQ